MSEHLPHITCPVCNMTSYHPEDVKHGYCGKCNTTTNGIVCTDTCIHKRLGAWEYNPIVNDWRSPRRSSAPKSWDGFIIACFVAAALICLGYVLYVVVIT